MLLKNASKIILFDFYSSEEDELETEDEDDDAYNDDTRPRLLSICSSEDGFIQFEEISPRCRSPPKIKENCSQFLKNFLVGVEDNDEDDSEEDDDWNNDESSDWDKSVDAIFMDDESLLEECGLHCQWMVQPKPKIKSIDTVDKSNNSFEDNAESYPNNGAQDYDVILKRIKTANDTWINSMEATDILKSSDNKVTFSEPLVTLEVEEDPTIAKDLQALRIDPQVQRHADKLRNERLFTPIFKDEHRAKMRSYIDNCF